MTTLLYPVSLFSTPHVFYLSSMGDIALQDHLTQLSRDDKVSTSCWLLQVALKCLVWGAENM
jgi:hypothetical protein